jgi:phosphoribosylformimino-5-aminoimidazole carboxamide ribotide isomerase
VRIIPVIDLMNGVVVHARAGRRDRYRAVESSLCPDSAPRAVVRALLDLHSFDTVYVADLDALTGKGDHSEILGHLQDEHPCLKFWIDRGLSGFPRVSPGSNCIPVIGSESLSEADLSRLKFRRSEFILSLDFMGERLLGVQSLLERGELWPEIIIMMSLSFVGANRGPDFQRLERLRAQWPAKSFIAAGGVRDETDLRRLSDLGMDGVLVASALHSGALGSAALREFA